MAGFSCKGVCVKHFGFEPRYSNRTPEEKKAFRAKYMRFWRKGQSLKSPNHNHIDFEKYDYCATCEAVVAKEKGFMICPCCHRRLRRGKLSNFVVAASAFVALCALHPLYYFYLLRCLT